jgi:hypothetical protein
LNPLRRLKLKSKLRNCDYKLAGTVIKQQYYNENSHTQINRMIDHFMEDPGFDRALNLIEYNEMIVFYFTESCTDGLYVRKTPAETVKQKNELDHTNTYTHTYTEPSPSPSSSEDITNVKDSADSEHSMHLQQLQESEEWMDQMISRLSKKQPVEVPKTSEAVPEPIELYDEVELLENIEFEKMQNFEEAQDFEEAEVFEEVNFSEPIEVFEKEDTIEPFEVFEEVKKLSPKFPNVVATLKIDLHTMMKQLEEYRHQLAYHPHNEQQLINWIVALEQAVDEFSEAIDLIED